MRSTTKNCSKLEKESLFQVLCDNKFLIRLSCHDPRILKTFKALAISPLISHIGVTI